MRNKSLFLKRIKQRKTIVNNKKMKKKLHYF